MEELEKKASEGIAEVQKRERVVEELEKIGSRPRGDVCEQKGECSGGQQQVPRQHPPPTGYRKNFSRQAPRPFRPSSNNRTWGGVGQSRASASRVMGRPQNFVAQPQCFEVDEKHEDSNCGPPVDSPAHS